MKRTVLFVLTLALLALLPSAVATAQEKGAFEIGFDTGFNVSLVDDSDQDIISVGLPAMDYGGFLQNVRVGYQLEERFGIESAVGFALTDVDGDTFWRLGLGLDGYYNFPTDKEMNYYLRGGGALNVTGGGNSTDSQFGLGAGAGARFFLGNQWALRVELGGNRFFGTNELHGHWDITGQVGLSFFTR